MNLIFGDVTENRSPTLCDCHYVNKITFHLYNCLLSMFANFVVLLNTICDLQISCHSFCLFLASTLHFILMVTSLIHRHITMNLIQ